jgi:hypothetical protein
MLVRVEAAVIAWPIAQTIYTSGVMAPAPSFTGSCAVYSVSDCVCTRTSIPVNRVNSGTSGVMASVQGCCSAPSTIDVPLAAVQSMPAAVHCGFNSSNVSAAQSGRGDAEIRPAPARMADACIRPRRVMGKLRPPGGGVSGWAMVSSCAGRACRIRPCRVLSFAVTKHPMTEIE